jgi:anti-sigma factor RsiW
MKHCRSRQKTLWLDLYGELEPMERSEWERHLAGCASCRREKAAAVRVMDLIREAAPAPAPPTDGAARIVQRLQHRRRPVKMRRPEGIFGQVHGWAGAILSPRWRYPSVIVAACSVVIVTAALSLHGLTPFGAFGPGADNFSRTAAELDEAEVEVIQHLELLQEMDAVRKLVQRVDRPEAEAGPVEDAVDRRRSDADHGALV